MLRQFFNNKKVLVTGHTGFKGSWLLAILLELGAKPIGYALEPETDPNIFTSLKLENKIKNYYGDIRNYSHLSKVIQEEKPEIVFHLAAQPLVRRSYREPILTYETNVIGTVNILEAARYSDSIRTIINITTDKCYENKEWVYSYRELDRLGGYDPYSASKACAELVTSSYRNSFFNGKDSNTSLSSVRAGNVIGGGDWSEDRLIPDCIKALAQNKNIHIRNPHATRPWQHVLEPLTGYLLLAMHSYLDSETYSGAWNFGPMEGSDINVKTLVEKIIKTWGEGEVEIDKGPHPHEANFLKLDTSKAASILGFKSCLTIDQNLEMTVSWYKEYYRSPNKIYDYTINQIKTYFEKQHLINHKEAHV